MQDPNSSYTEENLKSGPFKDDVQLMSEEEEYNPDTPFPLRGKEIKCPVCGENIENTKKKNEIGHGTLVWGSICCVLTPLCFWLPCALPFCKDKRHFCPKCKASVGLTTYL